MKFELFLEKFKELLNDNIKSVKKKFIDPTELKERLLTRFRELFQDKQTQIERIASPETEEDLRNALNDPSSPAYKKMMNEIFNEIAIQKIVEDLIEKFLVEKYEATEQEKDEILKAMIAKEVAEVQKNMQEYALMLSAAEYKKLQSFTAEKLQNRIESRAIRIERLLEEKATINERLTAIEQIEKQQTADWKKYIDLQKNVCIEKINSGKLVLTSQEGKVIDLETSKRIIDKLNDAPPPNKLVNVISQSLQAAAAEKAAEIKQDESTFALPPPPPPPPLPPNAKWLANMGNVHEELRYVFAKAKETLPEGEEFSYKRAKAEARNKESNRQFAEIQAIKQTNLEKAINKPILQKAIEKANAKKTSVTTNEVMEVMYEEAWQADAEKIQQKQLLQIAETRLLKKTVQQKVETELYKKMTGKDFIPKAEEKSTFKKKPK